jgi:transposase
MNLIRSSKCSLKFATAKKREQWITFLVEFRRVVNLYITLFWFNPRLEEIKTTELKKEVLDQIEDTWLTQRAKACAARQALTMCQTTHKTFREKIEENKKKKKDNKNRKKDDKKAKVKCLKSTCKKPVLRALKAELSANCATLHDVVDMEFDTWLHLNSLGKKISLDLPLRFHKHYNVLKSIGTRMTSFTITDEYIQIPFEIQTEKKLPKNGCVGLDSGINALASLSTGEQFGTEVSDYIDKIKRCKQGSKAQKRTRKTLRQYIDRVVKDIMGVAGLSLLVVENLAGITQNTKKNPKRRLGKEMRRSVGNWNIRYFHKRLEYAC